MISLTLLQVIPKENNVAFWLMMVVFIIIVLLVAKRYIKDNHSSNNGIKDNPIESQHPIARNITVHKPINKSTDKFQQLRDLKELLDEGVLTQDEFDLEKTKVLNTD